MENFKAFVLENTLEAVAAYCEKLAKELGCAESEIGMKAIDAVGTFYCPEESLAARFGFLTEENLNGDCEEIARNAQVEAGEPFIKTEKVIDALHQEFSQSRFNDGFYGGEIIFVDLKALSERFASAE